MSGTTETSRLHQLSFDVYSAVPELRLPFAAVPGIALPWRPAAAREITMLIGKPGPAKTHICLAHADRIDVRGHDLTGDLMGRLSFTDYFYFLMTGREPTANQRYFLDLLLVAIAEHGLTPTVI